jgi:hypothetical protein
MGRRPKVLTEGSETAAATPVVRRRRRTTVDHGAQGQILVASLLKSRGESGATQEEALAIVLWARGIHEEAAELKALSMRVRRAKNENAAERQVALMLNQSLLDGVIAGSLAVDVSEAGAITFSQA